jgi:hypothetical protein
VRLSLSKKPFGEGYHVKEHVDGRNTWFEDSSWFGSLCF